MSDDLLAQIKAMQKEIDRLKAFEIARVTPWQAYPVLWTSTAGVTTLGNGTLVGRYCQVGKLMAVHIDLHWGNTTSSTGTVWYFTLPAYVVYTSFQTGAVLAEDSGSQFYAGIPVATSNLVYFLLIDGSAFYNPTVPMTWADGDNLIFNMVYEVL